MKYFSMFSGIGGFELGIERATNGQWECIGFSEIDKHAIATYSNHFPNHKNYGDAKTINPIELPDFDLLCGGFPCQSFSIAGKRLGFEDTRGTLFFEIARIIEAKRPRLLLLENVKGLLNHDNGRTFATILASLDELGYNVEWEVLNSKYFGVPQNRERVFIVGHIREGSCRQIFPIGAGNEEYIGETNEQGSATTLTGRNAGGQNRRGNYIVGTLRTHKDGEGFREMQSDVCPTIPARAREDGSGQPIIAILVLTPERAEKRQNGRRFKENNEDMFTLTGQDNHGVMILSHTRREGDPKGGGTGPLISNEHSFTIDTIPHRVITEEPMALDLYNNKAHSDRTPTLTEPHHNSLRMMVNKRIRRLTPIECERLQGFPDNWTIGSDTQRYKQCGNAVTTNVIEEIIRRLT